MTNNTTFMHYRKFNNGIAECKGGATVAIHGDPGDTFVFAAIAHCNKNDHFNKAIGRAISAGRVKAYKDGKSSVNRHIMRIEVLDGESFKAAVHDSVRDEMAEHGLQ